MKKFNKLLSLSAAIFLLSFGVTPANATPVATLSAAASGVATSGIVMSGLVSPEIEAVPIHLHGDPRVGNILTVDTSGWAPAGISFSYEWKRIDNFDKQKPVLLPTLLLTN